jgi:hypothetical protein
MRLDGDRAEYCVTLFQRSGAWSWCIACDEGRRLIWAKDEFGAEREALDDAWLALEKLER